MGIKPPSESGFLSTFTQAAEKLFGFKVYHTHDSRKSRGGFPDCVCYRGPKYTFRLFVAELKCEGGKATPEQLEVLDCFRAMGIPAFLWQPSDWPEILKVLAQG